MKLLIATLSALLFTAGLASAQQAFASANTGWSVNSSFSTFGSGSHSFGGGLALATGSAAEADDGFFFSDSSNAGAWSASGGVGGASVSTFSGFSSTSMDFMGLAESGAQASD